MEKKISLNNFRVFKNQEEFEFRPFTILTGTNSSGKSSLLKAIKLLKKNFISQEDKHIAKSFDRLDFQDEKQQLGGFEKVRSKYVKHEVIEFTTNYLSDLWGELTVSIAYEKDKNTNLDNGKIKQYELRSGKNIIARATYKNTVHEKAEELEASGFLVYKGEYIKWTLEYLNKELWIQKIYELNEIGIWQHDILQLINILQKDDWLQVRENSYNGLNIKQKQLLEDFFKQGFSFDFSKGVETFDEVEIEISYGGKWKVIDKNGSVKEFNYKAAKLQNKKGGLTKFLFLFEFIKELDRLGIKNFKSIDFESLSTEEEKQRAYELTELLIKNNINSIHDLRNLIHDIEKDYIKRIILKDEYTLSPQLAMLDQPEVKFEKFSNLFYYKEIIEQPYDFLDRFEKTHNILNYIYETEKEQKGKSVKDTIGFLQELVGLEFTNSLKAFTDFNKFAFIDSDRADIKRLFFDNNRGTFGQILNMYQKLPKDFTKKRIPFINKWLKEFDIAEEFILERDFEGLGVRPYVVIEGDKVLLGDLGFGINQLLPIIIRIASLKNGVSVFIEEPESNLHPAYQSKLAEMFVDAHKQFNMSFVFETHSEYLIRKFQYLVANPESEVKNTDISIYYLYHPEKVPEGHQQVEKLEMRPDGILKQDFGKGFFDESTNLTMDLLKFQSQN